MKKVLFILAIFYLAIVLASCNRIKEYDGKTIVKINYQTIDYNGGYTNNIVLDFVHNEFLSNGFLPGEEQEPNLEVKKTFSDEEEKAFINGCYSNGLFDLKDMYKRTGIIDGGGWSLVIKYEDGSTKESIGINKSPVIIFNKCSTYFYDLCGEQILGNLPDYYYNPPKVSYSFHYEFGDYGTASDGTVANVSLANYKWNKFESSEKNLYLMNEALAEKNQFLVNNNYELVLYTANYDCSEKFKKIVVMSYDYNEELTNETLVYQGSWFSQVEIELELDKIYKYTIKFKDEDFAEYTFNTKSLNSKILYGKYNYNIYEDGQSELNMNSDGTYELLQFNYFDRSKNVNESIKGQYKFEVINGTEYVCLYTLNEERIVLESYTKTLIVNPDLSTFDLASYHLESKSEFKYDSVMFTFRN